MELKGVIKLGEERSLTCCEHVRDILVGDKSLYDELESLFKLDSEKFWEDSTTQSPAYSMRYVVLKKAPKKELSFDEQAADVVIKTITGQHVSGCYSEWTCGYGGFDYVASEDGHSIFKELANKVGQFVHLKM